MARPSEPVKLEGARGPLSVQRSKEILDGLKGKNKDAGSFERHMAIEEAVAGTPLVIGNRAALLQDGKATYDAMLAAIAAAKDHINMETYIIEDDDTGKRFADALIDKQRKGVQVNFIYDSVGSINTPREFFKRMADSGIAVLEYNPINPLTAKAGWDVNQRDHRKLLVVDGQVAFLGGVNISSVYSGRSGSSVDQRATNKRAKQPAGPQAPWRDMHLMLEGPVVAHFQKLFLATWESQKGKPLAPRKYLPELAAKGKEVVRAIGSSPDDGYSLMYATLISAIRNAESTVYVTNAYFVPDQQFLSALTEAARRGVDVRLILPSTTDSWLVLNAGRSYYSDLLEAGVKIYERRNQLLHSKTVVIDGVWSTIGSTNLDWRSFLHNQEVNAVILGPEFGAQMRRIFESDIAQSNVITAETWRQRSLGSRMREGAARVWEYWL
ncbi:MAG TPA: cardiolipin synthase [Steroidobacteraceae bacterium]|nr:cardiolipin synthase [Steroidobacteraceae bacterium]